MLTQEEIRNIEILYSDKVVFCREYLNRGRKFSLLRFERLKQRFRQTAAWRVEAHYMKIMSTSRGNQNDDTVDHIDEDFKNDDISNLKIISRSENSKKSNSNRENSGLLSTNCKISVPTLLGIYFGKFVQNHHTKTLVEIYGVGEYRVTQLCRGLGFSKELLSFQNTLSYSLKIHNKSTTINLFDNYTHSDGVSYLFIGFKNKLNFRYSKKNIIYIDESNRVILKRKSQ